MSEILRVNMNMNQIMNLILDSLLQEHGVESHSSINKQIRTCRFAGLHGDASTPYVACEATTTAADPLRRTTQPATCVRIPGDFCLYMIIW